MKTTTEMKSAHKIIDLIHIEMLSRSSESQISTIETAQVQIPTVTCELASDISTSEAGDCPPPEERKDTLKVSQVSNLLLWAF